MILEILNWIVAIDECSGGVAAEGFGSCPGSTFTAIAASYGTQGMWVMADLVQQIIETPLGAIAPLLYVVSAFAGLTSLALGAPPRMYLWFFMGPAVFHWLLETHVPAKGMQWQVAGEAQNQKEVWRLSEVGLLNSNLVRKGGLTVSRGEEPEGSMPGVDGDGIAVPLFFAWYDYVLSGTIQGLVGWTGVFQQRAGMSADSSVPTGTAPDTTANDKWYLLANQKWGMVENITNAKVSNPSLRMTLIQFLGSECGQRFSQNINASAMTDAMYGKGKTAPASIFKVVEADGGDADPLESETYEELQKQFKSRGTPLINGIRDVLQDNASETSFRNSVQGSDDFAQKLSNRKRVRCDRFFGFLISAFRWEAGQIYQRMMDSAPKGFTRNHIVYNLLYGWNVRKDGPDGTHLQPGEEQENFVKDLIFIHLLRNEFSIATPVVRDNQLTADSTQTNSDLHLRFVATKNKYVEWYKWAMMMPHLQGILLYYLAIGYPIACLLLLVPGWHKTMFTWMSFWAWAKLWDLGFALVMALERNVWAMLGNGSTIGTVFSKVAKMQDWGITTAVANGCDETSTVCKISEIQVQVAGNQFNLTDDSQWGEIVKLFDRGMTLAANLDLDLQNSYYIFIMSALYFAIPMVAGQLVLGAKSGMASSLGGMFAGIGQEGGRMAAAGAQSDWQTRMRANFDVAGQTSMAGTYQNGIDRWMGAANRGMESDLAQQKYGTLSTLNDRASNLASYRANSYENSESRLLGSPGIGGKELGKSGMGSSALGSSALGSGNKDGGMPGAAKGTGEDTDTNTPGTQTGNGAGTTANGTKIQTVGFGGIMGNLQRLTGSVLPPGIASSAGGNKVLSAGTDAVYLGSSMLGHDLKSSAINANAEATRSNAMIDSANFMQRGISMSANSTADRERSALQFQSEQSAWNMRNAYANNLTQMSAALGGMAGGFTAGPAPSDGMGMSMTGFLGSAPQQQAHYGNLYDQGNSSNGFWNDYNKGTQQVSQAAQDAQGVFRSFSLWEPAVHGTAHTAAELRNIGSGQPAAGGPGSTISGMNQPKFFKP